MTSRAILKGWALASASALSLVNPKVIAPIVLTYASDPAMGMGFDADGLTSLPLRSGAIRIWRDSVSGSDSYAINSAYVGFLTNADGSQGAASGTAGPWLTRAKCYAAVQQGRGDHIMFGGSFADGLGNTRFLAGFSPQYPTAIRSYDRTNPANQSKWGRAYVPLCTGGSGDTSTTGNANENDFIAIQGFDANPGLDVGNVAWNFVAGHNYLLIENNKLRGIGISTNYPNSSTLGLQTKHIIRKNSFYGQYATSGGAQGFFTAYTDGLSLEGNLFWHCGFKRTINRITADSSGGPTIFNHAMYLGTSNYNAKIVGNLVIDPSSHGLQARGGGQVYYNWFLDCPLAAILGSGDQYGKAYPGDGRFAFLFVGNPVPTDSITINGVVVTFGTDVTIGANQAATIANLKTFLDASANPALSRIRNGNPVTIGGTTYNPGYIASGSGLTLNYDSIANSLQDLTIDKNSSSIILIQAISPTSLVLGKPNTAAKGYRPDGVSFDAHHNLVIGDADITWQGLTVDSLPPISSTITAGVRSFTFIANGATPVGDQIARGTDTATTATAIASALSGFLSPISFTVAGSTITQVATGSVVGLPIVWSSGAFTGVQGQPRGFGLDTANGDNTSKIRQNAIAWSRDRGVTFSRYPLDISADFPQPSIVNAYNNVIYKYGSAVRTPPAAFAGQISATYNNNQWDAASNGTNVNNAGITYPQPYQSSALITAIGYANKQAMIDDLIENPMKVPTITLAAVTKGLTGFGINLSDL